MPQIDTQKILQELKHNPIFSPKYCDNCGVKHNSEDLTVVNAKDGIAMLQLSCGNCNTLQVLRLAPGAPIAIQRFEANNSDIKGAEFKKFAGSPSVDKDEALDVYAQMQKVETLDDFLGLLENPRQ